MTLAIVILSVLCIVFLSTTVILMIGGLRAARRIQMWESLFVDSHEDIGEAYEIFSTLVNRRSLLADDPDVIRIRKVFGVVLDILGEHIKNGTDLADKALQENKEKKEG